jgi:voltage-dependent calcium channel L type alpha-1D
MSIVELILTPPSFLAPNSEVSGGAITALRTFRLVRLFKLVRSWTTLQELLKALQSSVEDVGNFIVLLIIFMYIFTLLGMQLFANKLHFDPLTMEPIAFDPRNPNNGYQSPGYNQGAYLPRTNFNNFLNAFVTTFQVLTTDNWTDIMFDCWRAEGTVITPIFFVVLVVIGNFVMLQLFVAILLGNFEQDEDEKIEIMERKVKPGNNTPTIINLSKLKEVLNSVSPLSNSAKDKSPAVREPEKSSTPSNGTPSKKGTT